MWRIRKTTFQTQTCINKYESRRIQNSAVSLQLGNMSVTTRLCVQCEHRKLVFEKAPWQSVTEQTVLCLMWQPSCRLLCAARWKDAASNNNNARTTAYQSTPPRCTRYKWTHLSEWKKNLIQTKILKIVLFSSYIWSCLLNLSLRSQTITCMLMAEEKDQIIVRCTDVYSYSVV